jgi:hypothetical protein
MFWILRKVEGNETLFGDLFQPDFPRSRQWMRRMQGHTNCQTFQPLENQLFQILCRHLDHHGHMETPIIQSAQHFLSGQIVKPHGYPRVGLPEVSQRARQEFNRQ